MKKIILVSALCLGLAFCLLLLFLPALLSSQFILDKVLAQVNTRPTTSLQIKDFTIGWRQGLRIDSLTYLDSVRGIQVSVDQVQGDRGLLALLAAPKKLGTIRVLNPVCDLLQRNKGVSNGHPASSQKSTPADVDHSSTEKIPPGEQLADQSAPPWEDVAVRIIVEGGRIIVRDNKGKNDVPEGTIALTSSLDDGTVNYTVQWQGGAQGEFAADGYLNLPARWESFLTTLVAKTHLTFKRFQVAPILALAARGGKIPTGKGVLDGEITVNGAGLDKLDLLGRLSCGDLALSGGILGTDHPRAKKIALQIDGGKKNATEWYLSHFSLDGDPGQVRGSGRYGAEDATVQVKGLLHVPFFLTQLPHLCKLQQGVAVTAGDLDFDAELSRQGENRQLQVQAAVKQVAGVLNKRRFSWPRAASLSLAGSGSAGKIIVDTLDLTTAFAHLQGKGEPADFSLNGTLDLAKANQQIGRLFALPWSGAGKLFVQANSKSAKDDRYQIQFQTTSSKISLSKQGKTLLPASPLKISGRIVAPADWLQKKGRADISLEGTLWPGKFSVSATGITRRPSGMSSGYDLSADLQLERLSRLLHNLGSLPSAIGLGGRFRATAAGYLAGKTIALRELDAGIKGLAVVRGTTLFKEDNLVVQTKKAGAGGKAPIAVHKLQVASTLKKWQAQGGAFVSFDTEKQRLSCRDLLLRSSLADVDVHTLRIDDLRRIVQSWQADLNGSIDLARLNGFLPKESSAKKEVQASGKTTFVLQADQRQKPYPVALDFTIPRFRLVQAGKVIFPGQKVSAVFRSSGLLSGGKPAVSKFQLDTPPLALQARGNILRAKATKIDLQGKQTIDFVAVAQLVKAYTGLDLVMRGRRQHDFNVDTTLDKKGLEQGRLATSLWLERLSFSGIEAGPLTIPVSLAGGSLQAGIQGGLNNGRISLATTYHLGARPPDITMPKNYPILTDVRIDKPLADGVLARIHPLFGVLARPSGSVSGTMEQFYWPLTKGGGDKARFRVVFDVSRVALDSRGVLQEVLRLLNVADQTLTLKQSEITCTGENGRIGCTPVRVLVADSEMTISGSVGLDQTIDYLLEIPVTEKLIGREGARVLEGTTIKVPIRGTLKQPDFNRNMITDTLSDLAGQAAKKAIKDQVKKLVPDLFKGLKF